MALSVLQLFVLFLIVFAVYGDTIPDLIGNDGDIKAVEAENNIKHHSPDHLDPAGTSVQRTYPFTKPNTSSTVSKPTPITVILPPPPPLANSTEGQALSIVSTATQVPNPTRVPTKPETTGVPICGRNRFCYRWFDDELELNQDGYQRCNIWEDRVARLYCCVP